jgi:hypothetical protein
VPNVRCVNCRSDISVPDSYAQGDHVKCGACGTRHKVQRGESLRLVIADTAPLKEALQSNEQLISRLEEDLSTTRKSFGLGVNGALIGVAYVGWQVVYEGQLVSAGLIGKGVAVALVSALFLEVANFLFLTKRLRMVRISGEIEDAKEEGRRLQQRIRDAGRL